MEGVDYNKAEDSPPVIHKNLLLINYIKRKRDHNHNKSYGSLISITG